MPLPETELRQIKWLLAAILAMLILLAFAVIPGFLAFFLVAAGVCVVIAVILGLSDPARAKASLMWRRVKALWQR